MGKPYGFFKITLLVLNTIFLILGALLLSLGAYALNNLKEVSKLISTGLPVGLIVLGVFIFVVSFFGCCGAAIENRLLILIYGFILLGLLICQVCIGAIAYTQSADLGPRFQEAWNRQDNVTHLWFEKQFGCCGYHNLSDDPTCQKKYPQFTQPCGPELEEFFSRNMMIIFYIGLVFGILEIIGLFFACILYCCISSRLKSETREKLLQYS